MGQTPIGPVANVAKAATMLGYSLSADATLRAGDGDREIPPLGQDPQMDSDADKNATANACATLFMLGVSPRELHSGSQSSDPAKIS